MYGPLTTAELAVLKSVLFEGSEEAYRVACVSRTDPGWAEHRQPVHRELAQLFMEAGTELFLRLDRHFPQIA
jgi:hypothetical protein